MLISVLLSVIVLNVIVLNVVMLSVIVLNAVIHSVILLIVFILSVMVPNVVMVSVMVPNVVTLSVVIVMLCLILLYKVSWLLKYSSTRSCSLSTVSLMLACCRVVRVPRPSPSSSSCCQY